jgi:hypothetical protein
VGKVKMWSLGLHKLPTPSRTRKRMAAIPCPDTAMNKGTRLMKYEYNVIVLYTGYLIRILVKFTSVFKMLIYPFRIANWRFQNVSIHVIKEVVRWIILKWFLE